MMLFPLKNEARCNKEIVVHGDDGGSGDDHCEELFFKLIKWTNN